MKQKGCYNPLIEKPRIKHPKNINLLHKRSFYDKLSIVKVSQAFKGYARSYKIEIIDFSLKNYLEIRSFRLIRS